MNYPLVFLLALLLGCAPASERLDAAGSPATRLLPVVTKTLANATACKQLPAEAQTQCDTAPHKARPMPPSGLTVD